MKAEQQVERFSFTQLIGPGLLVAAAGIGAGDIVSPTIGGANYGLALPVAVAPIPLAFVNQALVIIRTYTITNAVLILALIVFALVGAREAGLLAR